MILEAHLPFQAPPHASATPRSAARDACGAEPKGSLPEGSWAVAPGQPVEAGDPLKRVVLDGHTMDLSKTHEI